MNRQIQDFIEGKRVAVVGASQKDRNKFGNLAASELRRRGYQVYLVHPQAVSISGERTYPNLEALRGQVDGVLISLPPAKSPTVLQDAAALGLRNVWIQQGGESAELVDLGKQLELNLVTGRCILMYAQPVRGMHSLHRWIARLTGQL